MTQCDQFKDKYSPKDAVLSFTNIQLWKVTDVNNLNTFIDQIMKTYWYDPDAAKSKYAEKALHGIGNVFVKLVKVVSKATTYDVCVVAQAKLEFEMRAKLADSVDLPPPISKEPVKTDKEAEALQKENVQQKEFSPLEFEHGKLKVLLPKCTIKALV